MERGKEDGLKRVAIAARWWRHVGPMRRRVSVLLLPFQELFLGTTFYRVSNTSGVEGLNFTVMVSTSTGIRSWLEGGLSTALSPTYVVHVGTEM
ncbi:hypothetical protein L484_022379 [Morus notabilis]|uniref:Uncharacterized protein n=1 Tax=Morus notabilis TaxID=981085 RepID=W9QRP7_9ROSA|nr:hypothetical protein L484_022379 [Morus notabilis]